MRKLLSAAILTIFIANTCFTQEQDSLPKISHRDSISIYAREFLGTPYKYATQNPKEGFDCSGFVNYVFTHFNYKVPRISRMFDGIGPEVAEKNAQTGDIILFTGTKANDPTIGHIGIIIENNEHGIFFIHASSGKNMGVIISPLEGYYRKRFVKIISIARI
ncbi:MAG: C40 family peptidase [Chitinophagales bacterium]|nr:C40 family peptidase [Chitinophagales bacterium]